MKRFMKWLAAVMVCCLAGCASTGISESKVPSSDKGVVFASVLFSGSYSENSIFIRKVGESDFTRIGLGESMILVPIFPKGDFADIGYNAMGKKGAVLAEELPPGDYEVFDWRVRCGYRTVVPQRNFSMPFTVVPGQAVYLGSFKFTHHGYMVSSATVVAEDLLARDGAIFDEKFKGYKGMEKKSSAPAEPVPSLGGSSSSSMQIPVPLILPAR